LLWDPPNEDASDRVLGIFEKAFDKEGFMGMVPWHLDLQCKSFWILNEFFPQN
jgi:hypothetical protein